MTTLPANYALRHPSLFLWLVAAFWLVLVGGAMVGWWRPRVDWVFMAFVTLVALVAVSAWSRSRRERLIREAPLPQFLKRKLHQTYPHLAQKDTELVERGLRQFFLASSRSGKKQFISMPSRVVDAMWHEFILHTQAYRDWCQLTLGRFLHHTPAEALGGDPRRNDGLRRAWFWACKDEAIDPRQPTRLPLLFALDAKLKIENGYHYVPDCRGFDDKAAGDNRNTHCAGGFSDDSAAGDAGDFGGADAGGGGDGCGGD